MGAGNSGSVRNISFSSLVYDRVESSAIGMMLRMTRGQSVDRSGEAVACIARPELKYSSLYSTKQRLLTDICLVMLQDAVVKIEHHQPLRMVPIHTDRSDYTRYTLNQYPPSRSID